MAKPLENQILNKKYITFCQALTTFEQAMGIDLSLYAKDPIALDAIQNGQIQKFEYTLELTWKFIKKYLFMEKGIDTQGPKDAIRAFGKLDLMSPDEISALLQMIGDRNRIAHEYKDIIMKEIYPILKNHLKLINKIKNNINL